MKGARSWAIYAVLLAGAAAVGLITRGGGGADSPVPSVENAGAAGTKVLFEYLRETGRAPIAHDAPLTELPPEARVLVIPAPMARELSQDEVNAVESFVRTGGTLVFLAPRPFEKRQVRLGKLLGVEPGRAQAPSPMAGGDDFLGMSAEVGAQAGLVRGVKALRVAAEQGVELDDPSAVPIASGGALWAMRLGKGEVWVAAGPSLAQNNRLELEGNLLFWENAAARGPIAFDGFHHAAAAPPAMSVAIAAFALQFLAAGLFFAFARGSRLGPARPELVERHRSTLEYLGSMAWLTRSAKVERELVPELLSRLRLLMQDRLGIAIGLSDADAAVELVRHADVPAAEFLALARDARAAADPTAKEYAELARRFARIERIISGRRG